MGAGVGGAPRPTNPHPTLAPHPHFQRGGGGDLPHKIATPHYLVIYSFRYSPKNVSNLGTFYRHHTRHSVPSHLRLYPSVSAPWHSACNSRAQCHLAHSCVMEKGWFDAT